mmetsp:Transcript_68399/g.164174  ORF Transcript_68399/g.164174 Transcript_68399/m.164174 type:complete len:199 (+) Transcript_68399:741-1337(+)
MKLQTQATALVLEVAGVEARLGKLLQGYGLGKNYGCLDMVLQRKAEAETELVARMHGLLVHARAHDEGQQCSWLGTALWAAVVKQPAAMVAAAASVCRWQADAAGQDSPGMVRAAGLEASQDVPIGFGHCNCAVVLGGWTSLLAEPQDTDMDRLPQAKEAAAGESARRIVLTPRTCDHMDSASPTGQPWRWSIVRVGC